VCYVFQWRQGINNLNDIWDTSEGECVVMMETVTWCPRIGAGLFLPGGTCPSSFDASANVQSTDSFLWGARNASHSTRWAWCRDLTDRVLIIAKLLSLIHHSLSFKFHYDPFSPASYTPIYSWAREKKDTSDIQGWCKGTADGWRRRCSLIKWAFGRSTMYVSYPELLGLVFSFRFVMWTLACARCRCEAGSWRQFCNNSLDRKW
jgi:hypothetical protein